MKMKYVAGIVAVAAVFAGMQLGAPAVGAASNETIVAAVIREPVATECEKTFLGLKPWYSGLVTKAYGSCTVGTPDSDKLPLFVWTIVLNVLSDLFLVLAYATIFFIIYGGWLFMSSNGEPAGVAKGKTTIVSAVIGLGIALLANLIVNTIVTILNASTS